MADTEEKGIPRLYFGNQDASKHNWRKDITTDEIDDDNDEPCKETPEDVVMMTGLTRQQLKARHDANLLKEK